MDLFLSKQKSMREMRKTPKVGLVCSSGGHLVEIELLKASYQDFPHFLITQKTDNTKNIPNAHFLSIYISNRNVLRTIKWFFQNIGEAYHIIKEQRPTVLISTGGGDLAIPVFIVGKLMGVKLVYIEHIGRFSQPSSVGKILYWISDRFFVQSKPLLRCYGKKAEYHGAVI